MTKFRGTTILAVRKNGKLALGGDGQVTINDTVMKSTSVKVRALKGGKVLAGFAGSVADALTLFEKFEEKLERYPGNLPRAAVELAKKKAGLGEATVVTYRRAGEYQNNVYSRLVNPAPGLANLANLDLLSLVRGGTPQFMYLWMP